MVSIDMPAGPSEVLVIADEHASPVYIAADLLSQVLSLLTGRLGEFVSAANLYISFFLFCCWCLYRLSMVQTVKLFLLL